MIQKVSKHYRRFVIALELLILITVSILGYLFLFPTGSTTKTLYFEKTDTPSILKNLQRYGYRVTPIDQILISPDALPQSGWYDLPDASRSRWYFFRHLGEQPAKTMKIRIYAGEPKREIISRLAQDTKLKRDRLRSAYEKFARFKEGDLLALTYRIGRKADADTLMAYLFGRSQRLMRAFFTAHYISPLDEETLRILLIIASIIEKETHNPKEMPLISAVIYNRLAKGMKLQMDGTLNYDTYAHTIVTPERIKNDTTFYNTYRYKGLPPSPLGVVSLQALEAAMFPAQKPYLFFMLSPKGGHTFSRTYQEHLVALKAFREYQKKKREHPLRKGASGKE